MVPGVAMKADTITQRRFTQLLFAIILVPTLIGWCIQPTYEMWKGMIAYLLIDPMTSPWLALTILCLQGIFRLVRLF